MFIEMGSNGSKDVTSWITVPLDDDYDETVFEGVFVLDQSMYRAKSTGTISILVNNEEVFTTGEIDSNTLEAFPVNFNFGDPALPGKSARPSYNLPPVRSDCH